MAGEDNKKNSNLIRTIYLIVYGIIAVCVVYVMVGIYEPSHNSLNALSTVSMDILCIIILFILIASYEFKKYGRNRTNRMFEVLLLATTWAIFLDFLNWAFDGMLAFGEITFWFTIGSLCMGAILACLFSVYLYCYMDDMHGLSKMKTVSMVCACGDAVWAVLTFILGITGAAFKFVDGHYETGVLYDVVTVVPVFTMIFLTLYVVRYVKRIGVHDIVAVVGYILFMIAGALIEAQYGIGTTYVSVALADIFIFVMLQNEIIANEKRNAEKWMQKSKTDELTGLANRHAYEEELATLAKDSLKDNFVYVSVDVNALKLANDTMGHMAGDELLIGATDCLKKCLEPYGKIFRIGGDEFVALLFANDSEIETMKRDIEATAKEWKGKIANSLALSCGFVSRTEMTDQSLTLSQMIALADKRMYEEKNQFYQRTGIERRKVY